MLTPPELAQIFAQHGFPARVARTKNVGFLGGFPAELSLLEMARLVLMQSGYSE